MSNRDLCSDISKLANRAITAHDGGHTELAEQISEDLFDLLGLACSGEPEWHRMRRLYRSRANALTVDTLVDQPRSNLPYIVAVELVLRHSVDAEPLPAWCMWANTAVRECPEIAVAA